LGLALCLFLSRNSLSSYFALRAAHTVPANIGTLLQNLTGNLKRYWLGGSSIPYTVINGRPIFPLWAWPGLALGALFCIWNRRFSLLAWAALGLLPLALNGVGEPQRALFSWPALCMLAGLGMGKGIPWLSQKTRLAALSACAISTTGFATEGQAWLAHRERFYPSLYAESAAQLRALDRLKELSKEGPMMVLDHLDCHNSGAFRFFLGKDPNVRESSIVAAFVPWYYLPALRGMRGRLETFKVSESGREAYLFFPEGSSLSRLRKLDSDLGKHGRKSTTSTSPGASQLTRSFWPRLGRGIPGCAVCCGRIIWKRFTIWTGWKKGI
jgi:hypothetical protein